MNKQRLKERMILSAFADLMPKLGGAMAAFGLAILYINSQTNHPEPLPVIITVTCMTIVGSAALLWFFKWFILEPAE